jgi:chemotaxis protein MotD
VIPETATSVSFQSARTRLESKSELKAEPDDRSPPGDAFAAMVDANAHASQDTSAQTPNLSDRRDLRPDRLPASRHAAPGGGDMQAHGPQASSRQPSQINSTTEPGTGIQKADAGTKASHAGHHHRHDDTEIASTGDAQDPAPAASDVTTADPAASSQPLTIPLAVAVPVTSPVVATPSAGDADTAAATAAIVPEATAPPEALRAAQTTAMQINEAGDTLAAVVAAAAPAAAKATAKATDNAQPARTAASVMTGLQPQPTTSDASAPAAAAASPNVPHDATPGDRKHDAVAADGTKTAASDTGAPAAQPGATAAQHRAAAADAAQPQPGQPDSGQPQGINSAVAQPQMQSTAATTTPAAPQYNVAVAAGAAVPLNGLAVQIAVTAQSGKSRFEIRLDPADLGRIDVRLDVDRQGRVTSHLTVEKPETLAMLRQDAPQLQRALQDAGLKTGDGGLQFSLRDQSSQGQSPRDDTGRNAQRLIVTEDDIVPAAAGRSYGRMLASSSGLDIRV